MKAPIETEIKLLIASAAKARALLRGLGFEVSARRIFEQNIVLDDGSKSLRERGLLLRVRRAGKTVTCTFKGPEIKGPEIKAPRTAARYKRRVENEFTASDLNACLAVFRGLGFRETFRYEKYRTEFKRDSERALATVDETPIGTYMELEGPARWIDRTAIALGFSRDCWITASYAQLYFDWCEKQGFRPSDMRF